MPKGGRKGGNAPKFTRQVPKFLQQYAALLGAERPDPTANDDHCYQSTAIEEGYDSESDKVVAEFLKDRTASGLGVEAEYQRERQAKADAKRREEEAKRKPTPEEVSGIAGRRRRCRLRNRHPPLTCTPFRGTVPRRRQRRRRRARWCSKRP